jgi:DNA-directed RNA polymerase alpha subunit
VSVINVSAKIRENLKSVDIEAVEDKDLLNFNNLNKKSSEEVKKS